MTGDARPEELNDLVKILTKSMLDETTIKSFATSVGAFGRVKLDGDAGSQWTELVRFASIRPKMWPALLSMIGEYLDDTIYRDEFLGWREQYEQISLNAQDDQRGQGRQSDNAIISKAVSDVRKSRSSLLALNDPRDGKRHLQTMRASIVEIKEIIEGMPGKALSAPLTRADDTDEAAAARSEILFACEEALKEVDQLTIDILEARRYSGRVRREYSGQEAFTAERSMLRHLLNDRGLVDLESQALIEVIDQQMAHLGIPVPKADIQRNAVPPPRPEPRD
jgi:hypothetical protein